jgi:hypothetical protein
MTGMTLRDSTICWRLPPTEKSAMRCHIKLNQKFTVIRCHIAATYLMHILDAAGHTSSLVECINGLLKSFLNNRRAFRNPDTAQAYLNLFVLWHNMRVYERGKRAGKSPYQWAGIDPGANDWLELLGYPPAA